MHSWIEWVILRSPFPGETLREENVKHTSDTHAFKSKSL